MDQDEIWHTGGPPPHTVLDGDPAPHGKGHSTLPLSKFTGAGFACVRIIRGPCLLWPNGWMDQYKTWHGGRTRPWPHCVRWGPSSSSPKGAQPSPIFGPCLLWPISATVEHLLHFAWVVDDAKCILVTRVCVSVCLSVSRRIPTLLHRPGCNLGNGMGCPLVVQYWADSQPVHGFRCYDNIARTRNISKCLYSRYAWFNWRSELSLVQW